MTIVRPRSTDNPLAIVDAKRQRGQGRAKSAGKFVQLLIRKRLDKRFRRRSGYRIQLHTSDATPALAEGGELIAIGRELRGGDRFPMDLRHQGLNHQITVLPASGYVVQNIG